MTHVPRGALVTAIVACLAVGVLLVAVSASLYGDGAVMLIQAINAGGSFVGRSRWLLNDVRDLPVVSLVRFGVTDTHVLSIAQSIGYVFLATAIWALALAVARRDSRQFVLFAVAAGMCLGTMASFGAAELLLSLSLVGLITALLARAQPWTWPAAATAVASATVLVIAHESLIAPAALWGLHAGWRALRSRFLLERIACLAVAGAALGCVLWGTVSLTRVPDGGSAGFLVAIQQLMPVSAVLLMAGGAAAFIGSVTWVRERKVAAVAVTVAATVWTVSAVAFAIRLGPGAGYAARAWCLLAIVVVQVIALIAWARAGQEASPSDEASGTAMSTRSDWPVSLAVGYLLVALMIPVGNAIVWTVGLADVQRAVTSQTGLLDPSVLPEAGQRALFSWTNPYLSLVLRSDAADGVFVDPHPETEAWTPEPLRSADEAHSMLAETYVWR